MFPLLRLDAGLQVGSERSTGAHCYSHQSECLRNGCEGCAYLVWEKRVFTSPHYTTCVACVHIYKDACGIH